MKGLVSWTAEGYESGYGKVTICKQDDTRLNVVFTCRDVGEGQITLAITTAEQFASARFVYDEDERTRTFAGVVGRMSWQPESLQFEGRWDDQDADTVWSFSIEVEEFNLAPGTTGSSAAPDPQMESLDEILDTLDRRYLTDWFEPDVTPALPGVYRVEPHYLATSYLAYAIWDGTGWSSARRNVDELANLGWQERVVQGERYWLGLTEEGTRRVSRLLDDVRRRKMECTNSQLLVDLRHKEKEVARARADAHAVYEGLVMQIDRSERTIAARTDLREKLDRLVRADLDSPTESTFVETVERTVDDAHSQLEAALEQIAVRGGYWRSYWEVIMSKDPAFANTLTGKGQVVSHYGKDLKERLRKNGAMKPLPGSFGTKKRR